MAVADLPFVSTASRREALRALADAIDRDERRAPARERALVQLWSVHSVSGHRPPCASSQRRTWRAPSQSSRAHETRSSMVRSTTEPLEPACATAGTPCLVARLAFPTADHRLTCAPPSELLPEETRPTLEADPHRTCRHAHSHTRMASQSRAACTPTCPTAARSGRRHSHREPLALEYRWSDWLLSKRDPRLSGPSALNF